MAFRRLLSKNLYNNNNSGHRVITSQAVTLEQKQIPLPTKIAGATRKTSCSGEKGFFRRFRGGAVAQIPDFLSLPVGEKLRERLRGLNENVGGGDHRPLPAPELAGFGVTVEDARKLMRVAQVERLKGRVKEEGKATVSYSDFVTMCRDICGGSRAHADEFAKLMDRSGHVIVLGDVVFLRPDQMAKSMESLISQSMATPNDPRREKLKELEMEKSIIDKKARAQVKRELYCGLGFLTIQTLGFMRLTFWELSWDVMEPICFFVTSLHFALAYGFFLRTSTEPSFEGYFHRRFKAKQKRLMEARNFDVEKYNELRKVFYPSLSLDYGPKNSDQFSPFFYHQEGFGNYRYN